MTTVLMAGLPKLSHLNGREIARWSVVPLNQDSGRYWGQHHV